MQGTQGQCSVTAWREEGREIRTEGICVYLWPIHIDVWQKPSQYCKGIILPLKLKTPQNKLTMNNCSAQTLWAEGTGNIARLPFFTLTPHITPLISRHHPSLATPWLKDCYEAAGSWTAPSTPWFISQLAPLLMPHGSFSPLHLARGTFPRAWNGWVSCWSSFV